MLVNQTEDKCQHHRTSLSGRGHWGTPSFQADFAT